MVCNLLMLLLKTLFVGRNYYDMYGEIVNGEIIMLNNVGINKNVKSPKYLIFKIF